MLRRKEVQVCSLEANGSSTIAFSFFLPHYLACKVFSSCFQQWFSLLSVKLPQLFYHLLRFLDNCQPCQPFSCFPIFYSSRAKCFHALLLYEPLNQHLPTVWEPLVRDLNSSLDMRWFFRFPP